MRVGVIFSQADSGTDPIAIRQWARDAEAAGFDHLMAYDHVLGATAERLGPGPFGSFPSAPYTAEHVFHEILTLFSHLAAVTSTMRFVTSVLVLPQRQAVIAAKQIATIDLLSGGRIDLSVGVGWNQAEYEGLGADFSQRTVMLEEQIAVMRRLWREPVVDFDGRFHTLRGVGINPRPTRAIPILLGCGGSDAVLRRVVRVADGWMPLLIPGLDPMPFPVAARRLRDLCAGAGRDPSTLSIHGRAYLAPGWQQQVRDAVEAGCSHLSFGFNRLASPGRSHREHLDAVIAAKPDLDAIVDGG
jgi:probable F420-dependent oxidoreductase